MKPLLSYNCIVYFVLLITFHIWNTSGVSRLFYVEKKAYVY